MCRRTEEEVEPTVGLPRHRYFVAFFNVPVQTPIRDPPFYGYSEKPPHFSRLLRHAWGYGGHILDLNPPGIFLSPKRKRRSDSVLWQNPLYQQKIQKTKGQHTNATKNFDYITIADRLRTVSWSNKSSNWCGQTGLRVPNLPTNRKSLVMERTHI